MEAVGSEKEPILLRRAASVATIELNDPPYNRLSMALIDALEVELGVVPAWGGTQRLTRTVGRARALEIMLLAQKLDADEAFEAGLLPRVCEPEDLDAQVAQLASELAAKAPLAIAGILDAVVRGGPKSLEDGLLHEYAALERVMTSEDLQEGVMAFFQKRPPEFKGK
jgi:enoyl-CoA hydratase